MKRISLIQQLQSQEFVNPKEEPEQEIGGSSWKTFLKPKNSKCVVCKKSCCYRCPKCRKNYCGIEHFRSHNLFCSEQFYERQVKEALKGLKVTDAKSKKKAIQMVRSYQEGVDDDCSIGELTVERLEDLLKQIEAGEEPQLTQKEEEAFKQYLSSLNMISEGSDGTDQRMQLQQAYWEIQEGLSFYLQKDMEIEEFQNSENPGLIAERSLYKKQLQQFTNLHPYTECVMKPILNLHLIQIIFEYVMLYRVYDGQCQHFRNIFMAAYCSKENQALLKSDNIGLQQLISQIQIQLIRCQVDKDAQSVLQLWMGQYSQFLMSDLDKIFSNPLLVMETLLRINELISNRSRNYEQIVDKVNSSESGMHLSRQEKKQSRISTKIIKKCEYLLYFVKYKYRKQVCVAHLNAFSEGRRNRGVTENEKIRV